MFALLWFFVFLNVVVGRNEEYTGYRVYNVQFSNQHQQDNFHELKSDLVDYWRRPSLEYGIVGEAMVPPSHFNWFEEQVQILGLPNDVAIEDVFEYLKQKEKSTILRNEVGDRVFDYRGFYRYNEILNHLRSLEETHANSTINLQVIEYGRTDLDRPLVYLRISNNTDIVKPIVIIEAAINPRDWITVPSALYAVDRLLEGQRELLDEFEWIVIPLVNPDGYEYTHTNLRLWTKSRSTRSHLGLICPGVNVNRNFDMDWLRFDSSSSPCSHLYGGVGPFSEIESRLIRSLLEDNGPRIRLYISLQNNGGFVTYPWVFERAASGMFRQHHLLGLDMVSAMNSSYLLGVGSVVLGDRASGTSVDYLKYHEVLYTFNIDIVQRDGVVIPEEDILEIVEDVWRGIATAAGGVLR